VMGLISNGITYSQPAENKCVCGENVARKIIVSKWAYVAQTPIYKQNQLM